MLAIIIIVIIIIITGGGGGGVLPGAELWVGPFLSCCGCSTPKIGRVTGPESGGDGGIISPQGVLASEPREETSSPPPTLSLSVIGGW